MLGLDPSGLVFIDETWAKTNMTRAYGRAPVGERLVDYTPHGHWKTTTFIAALRDDGLTAPFVLDGAINGEFFLAYVREHLAPTLKPGDIVVLDNLSSGKKENVPAEARFVFGEVGSETAVEAVRAFRPEVVGVPLGFGHTEMGRWAAGIGENPRRILEAEVNGEGLPSGRITAVKVYKV